MLPLKMPLPMLDLILKTWKLRLSRVPSVHWCAELGLRLQGQKGLCFCYLGCCCCCYYYVSRGSEVQRKKLMLLSQIGFKFWLGHVIGHVQPFQASAAPISLSCWRIQWIADSNSMIYQLLSLSQLIFNTCHYSSFILSGNTRDRACSSNTLK